MPTLSLKECLADIILTSHYLIEPSKNQANEITDAEMRCLRAIALYGPMSMQDIAKKLHASKPRITQLATSLESRSLIQRTAADDKRRMNVTCTDKGSKTIHELEQQYTQLAKAIESHLGKKDTEALHELLLRITPITALPLEQ